MRAAGAVLKELVRHVGPPRGCALVLTEWQSSGPTDPNWVASCGIMDEQGLLRYNEKLAELRKADPLTFAGLAGLGDLVGTNGVRPSNAARETLARA